MACYPTSPSVLLAVVSGYGKYRWTQDIATCPTRDVHLTGRPACHWAFSAAKAVRSAVHAGL